MNKTQFAIVLCEILVLIILTTMLNVKKANVVGLVLIFFIISYYLWNDTINPLFGKVALFVIAYVLIVAAVGFFWNVSIEPPNFGLSMLLSKLDLSKNLAEAKTIIDFNKIDKPDSDKYTYSFSVFIEEFKIEEFKTVDAADATEPYIFYRNESIDQISTNKNIGLKLGKSTANFDTLYLEYVTGTAAATVELAKMPINQWTTVTIAVNREYVNVYVGGNKLTKQLTIDNLKTPSKNAPIQFGKMPAYLANFSHSPSVIEPTPSFIEYLSKTYAIDI